MPTCSTGLNILPCAMLGEMHDADRLEHRLAAAKLLKITDIFLQHRCGYTDPQNDDDYDVTPQIFSIFKEFTSLLNSYIYTLIGTDKLLKKLKYINP